MMMFDRKQLVSKVLGPYVCHKVTCTSLYVKEIIRTCHDLDLGPSLYSSLCTPFLCFESAHADDDVIFLVHAILISLERKKKECTLKQLNRWKM